jgi:hypothetical protein
VRPGPYARFTCAFSIKKRIQISFAHEYGDYKWIHDNVDDKEVSVMQRPMILRYSDGEDTPMIDEEFLRVTGVVTYFTRPKRKGPWRRKTEKVVKDDVVYYYV